MSEDELTIQLYVKSQVTAADGAKSHSLREFRRVGSTGSLIVPPLLSFLTLQCLALEFMSTSIPSAPILYSGKDFAILYHEHRAELDDLRVSDSPLLL
jgi:hypothetical protein